ncbi:MAG: hypothetical protein IKA85_07685 [Clostridia bacterium]|nr:hypothetical protein [Clostridia bacterium]
MFNIEEKIKKWYENQKVVPVVKTEQKEEKEKVYTTSNTSKNTVKDINELKNSIIQGNREYDRLKEEIVYEYENDPENEYSDKSLNKKAEILAETALEDSYNKENLRNKDKISEIDKSNRLILTETEAKKRKIEDEYDKRITDATDKAIKNGVSRSSILEGEREKFSESKDDDVATLSLNTENALKSNEVLKDLEEIRHSNVLNELDNKKDAEKSKQLSKLKEERQQLVEEGEISGNYNYSPTYVSPKMREIRMGILKDVLAYYGTMSKKEATMAYEKDVQLQKLLGDLEPAVRLYVTGKGVVTTG